jgi:hypothetical protein
MKTKLCAEAMLANQLARARADCGSCLMLFGWFMAAAIKMG